MRPSQVHTACASLDGPEVRRFRSLPFGLIVNTSKLNLFGSLGSISSLRVKTIFEPSGDQPGTLSGSVVRMVVWRVSRSRMRSPFACGDHTRYTSFLPSGE